MVLAHAQATLSGGSHVQYSDHQEAWIKPKLRESRTAYDCLSAAEGEYETTTRSYMAFLKSEVRLRARMCARA